MAWLGAQRGALLEFPTLHPKSVAGSPIVSKAAIGSLQAAFPPCVATACDSPSANFFMP